jgi:nitroreductase
MQLGAIFDELGDRIPGGPPERMHWEDVPALIVVCSEGALGGAASPTLMASIYPAVQNLLLAAHALGLGANITTRWKSREPEAKKILGLPDGIVMHAIVPIGWPDRRYGRGKRLPLSEVAYRERFGARW